MVSVSGWLTFFAYLLKRMRPPRVYLDLELMYLKAEPSARLRWGSGPCSHNSALKSFLFILCVGDQAPAAIAQLGERQTEDLKVPGSILGLGMSVAGSSEPQ